MTEKTTHVVVLGAGYAGLMAAMHAGDRRQYRARWRPYPEHLGDRQPR